MAYEYGKVDDLEKHELVGSHQCVALVQLYAGAPRTLSWKPGKAVLGNTSLKKGTAIATFVNGRYQNLSHGNHAALYLRQGINGIYVMDQWKNKKDKKISSRFIPSLGKDKKGRFVSPSDNADAFFVIE
ncbi:BPSL0067 family protein [Pseudoduganella aquatica]|uniref:BPSL0067 family protein n=1 Tax=Pseudoduganella aquatica TaxID=2660641 RepID=A0A7X4HCR5_9BURK|nr:BPSL0067 family protein [Pseudoduganella aquatica]MYN08851.1 BPSL0067 family protein [Pseudoduganella aquatica]